MGPGGAPRAVPGGPAPRLGAGAVPRGDLRALGSVRGSGRGPALAGSARAASVSYTGSGIYGYRHGESRYGYRAAYAAGAYAAGAYSGYAYGRSRDAHYSASGCYYAYKRHRRVLVCD